MQIYSVVHCLQVYYYVLYRYSIVKREKYGISIKKGVIFVQHNQTVKHREKQKV